jgi:hypothetical protein
MSKLHNDTYVKKSSPMKVYQLKSQNYSDQITSMELGPLCFITCKITQERLDKMT